MARVIIVLCVTAVLATGFYLGWAGVWGESNDLQSVRTGSAGVPYYGVRSVK
jgi:hypothetical protein